MPLLGEIPGYAQAVQRESFDRLAAFLACPERICGVEVQPFTPRLALELEAAGSPFLCGGMPQPGHVAAFLWHVSTVRHAPRPWWRSQRSWERFNRNRFIGGLARLDYFTLAGRIYDYINEANADGPGSGGSSAPAFASWVSGLVDAVARQYGWSEADVLDLPFKRIWQYWRRITHRESEGKALFLNPSDQVRAHYLDTLNLTTP